MLDVLLLLLALYILMYMLQVIQQLQPPQQQPPEENPGKKPEQRPHGRAECSDCEWKTEEEWMKGSWIVCDETGKCMMCEEQKVIVDYHCKGGRWVKVRWTETGEYRNCREI